MMFIPNPHSSYACGFVPVHCVPDGETLKMSVVSQQNHAFLLLKMCKFQLHYISAKKITFREGDIMTREELKNQIDELMRQYADEELTVLLMQKK